MDTQLLELVHIFEIENKQQLSIPEWKYLNSNTYDIPIDSSFVFVALHISGL